MDPCDTAAQRPQPGPSTVRHRVGVGRWRQAPRSPTQALLSLPEPDAPLQADTPSPPLDYPRGDRGKGVLLGQDGGRPRSVEVDDLPFAVPAVPDAGLL